MMLMLIKMMLKLLFMSNLQLEVKELNNVKHSENDISKELMSVAWHSRG